MHMLNLRLPWKTAFFDFFLSITKSNEKFLVLAIGSCLSIYCQIATNGPSVKQVSRETILPAKSRERGAHSRMIPDVLINSMGPTGIAGALNLRPSRSRPAAPSRFHK